MSKNKVIIKGKAFDFSEKTLLLPNSLKKKYIYVDHPGAVAIIPLLSKGRVILIRQFRPALEKFVYEIPAGTIDTGEKPVETAKRELVEEIGYFPGKITKIGELYPAVGYSNETLHIYVASGMKKTTKTSEEDEIIEPKVFSRLQIKKMVKNGKIKDSKTIAAFAMMGWI